MPESTPPISDPPIADLLFLVSYHLCKAYPALDPFRIDDLSFIQVAEVFTSTIRARREPSACTNNEIRTIRNGEPAILRPAGDNWF